MQTATPVKMAQSAAWDGPAPTVTVVVSSHGRATLLDGLLSVLEAQDHGDFEVIVADNGSADDTWAVLTSRCSRTSLRLRALRLEFYDGPAVPRNTCVAEARAELIAFTDDDCLPAPTWLSAMTAAFDDATDIVQGRTIQEPGGWAGPWGRTVNVSEPTGLYETANLAARRAAIVEVGGFAAERLLSGRAFGEDVVLGAAIARTGDFRFVDDALVHHRVMPGSFRDFIQERQRLVGFPLLLRQVPELRSRTFLHVFLSRRTAITDLAVVGVQAHIVFALLVVAGVLSYSRWPMLVDVAYLPWIVTLVREAGRRPGRTRIVRAAQLGWADLAGAAALVTGSLMARRLLL